MGGSSEGLGRRRGLGPLGGQGLRRLACARACQLVATTIPAKYCIHTSNTRGAHKNVGFVPGTFPNSTPTSPGHTGPLKLTGTRFSLPVILWIIQWLQSKLFLSQIAVVMGQCAAYWFLAYVELFIINLLTDLTDERCSFYAFITSCAKSINMTVLA